MAIDLDATEKRVMETWPMQNLFQVAVLEKEMTDTTTSQDISETSALISGNVMF